MDKNSLLLDPKQLATRCHTRQFDFASTQGLESDEDVIGQERAIQSLQFGLDMPHKGYNIYVMGYPGYGRHTLTRNLVTRQSRLKSTAKDWCYVYNFQDPLRPKALALAPGMGRTLSRDMDALIETFHTEFSTEIALNAIGELKKRYHAEQNVTTYLEHVLQNVIKHAQDFLHSSRADLTLFDQPHIETPPFSRLKVNVLVDNANTHGSPVIFEDNPIYHNLTGRVGNMSINGSLVSDFTLIRPGSLHRANNGFLIIDALEVINHHLAWEGLKRALQKEVVKIEPLEQSLEFWSSQTLDPEPIPLDVKVVLIGDRDMYYTLCEEDGTFYELFKVVSDLDSDMPRNKTNTQRYAKMIGSLAKEEQLKPFDRSAVAEIVDYGSRLTEDSERLSTHLHSLKNLLQQSHYQATITQKDIISRLDVKKALQAEQGRLNRAQIQNYDDILRDIILIETDGEKIGQINALTVVDIGDYEFGQPARISAVVHSGDGSLIDIQREVDLSGPIYSKGFLTLSGYLKGHYARAEKMSFSASIAFEQVYSSIHGDSASAAELCVLLSALAEIPLKQSIAVTGSINQFGQLQAISGVNEKIEGFFAICKARKLTGSQGVIIPISNVKNLMLSDEVIKAARKGQFHIYRASHVDQVMEILTGLPAGVRNDKDEFPEGTINHKVEYCLINYSEMSKDDKADEEESSD